MRTNFSLSDSHGDEWLTALLALPAARPGATSKPVAIGGRSADSLRRGFEASDAGRTTAAREPCGGKACHAESVEPSEGEHKTEPRVRTDTDMKLCCHTHPEQPAVAEEGVAHSFASTAPSRRMAQARAAPGLRKALTVIP